MSNRKAHSTVGAVVGSINAARCLPAGQASIHNIAEVLGGALGGVVGSRLPDIIEPAIHSHHRSFAHSVTVASGVATKGMSISADMASWCRDQAEMFRQRAVEHSARPDGSALAQLFYSLMEFLLHFAAGFVSGIPAGYVSHLAMDMTTPRSIPLVVRGF
ncbi:metal-dependent hydrolase [Archangium violaceum]|nr:metal-dependent hydrolase [Archangium violaceum]